MLKKLKNEEAACDDEMVQCVRTLTLRAQCVNFVSLFLLFRHPFFSHEME